MDKYIPTDKEKAIIDEQMKVKEIQVLTQLQEVVAWYRVTGEHPVLHKCLVEHVAFLSQFPSSVAMVQRCLSEVEAIVASKNRNG